MNKTNINSVAMSILITYLVMGYYGSIAHILIQNVDKHEALFRNDMMYLR